MPLTKHQILRYRIIDRELSKKKFVKSRKIQEKLLEEFDLKVSLKTIQNDINMMVFDSQLGYFAPIEYNQSQKAFYYTDPDYSIQKFGLKQDEIDSLGFVLNVFKEYSRFGILKSLVSAIKKIESTLKLEQGARVSNLAVWERVLVEPLGSMNKRTASLIPLLIQAIEKKRKISFQYKKFKDEESTLRKVTPAWLKEYQGFWYMIADEDSGKRKTFALDRIIHIEVLKEEGQVEYIDIEGYYHHSMGITTHNSDPIKIICSFNPNQGKYVKTVPIHHTQEILLDDENECRIGIEVIPSYELYAKLLSYGSTLRVIEPMEVRQKLISTLQAALENYSS